MRGIVGLVVIVDVAGGAGRRGAGKAVGMAVAAGGSNVGTGQREDRIVVVKCSLGSTLGMAFIAGDAVVAVATHILVLVVHVRLVVIMAIDAGKGGVIVWVLVAVGAGAPGAGVLTRINREILSVVDLEFRRFPPGRCGVTIGTGGGDIGGSVIGVVGIIVIGQMTGNAFRGGIGIAPASMAPVAGEVGVPFGQGEEIVIKAGTNPRKCGQRMTLLAVRGKTAFHVIRLRGPVVIGLVAVNALHPKGFEPQQGRGFMALLAIGHDMRPHQGETAPLVHACEILYDPGFRGMAPAAIRAYGLVVHVGMAIDTLGLGFGEHQGDMASPAVQRLMLPGEGESRRTVVKGVDLLVQLPSLGTVAYPAADREILSVWGIRGKAGQQDYEGHQQYQ